MILYYFGIFDTNPAERVEGLGFGEDALTHCGVLFRSHEAFFEEGLDAAQAVAKREAGRGGIITTNRPLRLPQRVMPD